LGRFTSRADTANAGKRTVDKTTGAPTNADVMIAAAQRMALEVRCFRFIGLSTSTQAKSSCPTVNERVTFIRERCSLTSKPISWQEMRPATLLRSETGFVLAGRERRIHLSGVRRLMERQW